MTRARFTQVSLDSTPYYHCICRCVRRAFLCGQDHYSGRDYEHRRQWVVERLATLVECFAVDLCAYAVMSNHYHIVVRIDRGAAMSWPDEMVAEKWMRCFKGPDLVRHWLDGTSSPEEAAMAHDIIAVWRERLFDLGWFMKCLNEFLARKANIEDDCKGRFWESRYKCQALLDQRALLTCMAYVDLNPVRARQAATPEESEYTSVKQRIGELRKEKVERAECVILPRLAPMLADTSVKDVGWETACGTRLMDYLDLVDGTGRVVQAGKRGVVSAHAAGILDRLGIDADAWMRHMKPGWARHPVALGAVSRLADYARTTGRRWVVGWKTVSLLYQA